MDFVDIDSSGDTASNVSLVNDKSVFSQVSVISTAVADSEQPENSQSGTLCNKLSCLNKDEQPSSHLYEAEARKDTMTEKSGETVVTSLIDDTVLHPDLKLMSCIIAQVEYYFSDANLPTDTFLLQQISRDKYGFVALSVIASFKKMRKLVTDMQTIAAALSQSTKLELSKNGMRVRRTHFLPADINRLLKTVAAINFPDPTLAGVMQRFSAYGCIVHVSIICRGEFVTGADVRRQVRGGLDSFGKAVSGIALVEFDNQESAQLACEHMTDGSNWRSGLHVSMVTVALNRSKKQSLKQKNADKQDVLLADSSSSSLVNDLRPGNVVITEVNKPDNEVYGCTIDELICKRNINNEKVQFHCLHCSPGVSSKLCCCVADCVDCQCKSAMMAGTESHQSSVQSASPWVQRRLKANSRRSDRMGCNSITEMTGDTLAFSKMSEVVLVIRQPKGPDGSRGFCFVQG
jgi:hypothetical protein